MAVLFNGSSQSFSTNNACDIANNCTLAFRLKSNSIASNQLPAENFKGTAARYGFLIQLFSSTIRVDATTGVSWPDVSSIDTTTLSGSTWYSFVWTRAGTATNWYIDGVLSSSPTVSTANDIQASSENLTLGANKGTANYLNGAIEDFRIYPDKVFTANEAAIYHNSNGSDNIITPLLKKVRFIGQSGAVVVTTTGIGSTGVVFTPQNSPVYEGFPIRIIK